MKPTFSLVQLLVTSLAICLLTVFFNPGRPAQAAPSPAQPTPSAQAPEAVLPACNSARTIQVSGTAIVNVQPNRVLIQLGVQSNGRSPKEVQSANAATISRVTKSLQDLGVSSKDIATDWYIIQPLYEDYDSIRIKGYRIHNMVAITLRDVSRANEIIAAAFQAGANQVVNVEYYTSDLRKYRDQARDLAMKAASEKAQDLAAAAGAETDCVLNINENSWSYLNDSGWSWWYRGGESNLWTQNVVQNTAPSGNGANPIEEGPVSPGQISIRAEVNASFSLK
jgi:uncharacterized protein YggE